MHRHEIEIQHLATVIRQRYWLNEQLQQRENGWQTLSYSGGLIALWRKISSILSSINVAVQIEFSQFILFRTRKFTEAEFEAGNKPKLNDAPNTTRCDSTYVPWLVLSSDKAALWFSPGKRYFWVSFTERKMFLFNGDDQRIV
jgi:hypothetical protein